MNKYTNNKYLDFVIENAQDIQSLFEVWNYANTRLPEWVDEKVHEAIKELMHGYFIKEDLECNNDGTQVYWLNTSIYDTDSDTGIFLGYEFNNWTLDTLVSCSPPDGGYLYTYLMPGGKNKSQKKSSADHWANKFSKKKNELKIKNIITFPNVDYNDPYLAVYYLNREININQIKRPVEFKKNVQKAVIDFTKSILPIILSRR